jgi:hypothetical protein
MFKTSSHQPCSGIHDYELLSGAGRTSLQRARTPIPRTDGTIFLLEGPDSEGPEPALSGGGVRGIFMRALAAPPPVAGTGCIVAWGGRASESSRRLSLADYKDTSLGRVRVPL